MSSKIGTPRAVPEREAVKTRAAGAQCTDEGRSVLDADSHPIAELLECYRAAVYEVVLRAITPTDGLDDCLSFVSEAKSLI